MIFLSEGFVCVIYGWFNLCNPVCFVAFFALVWQFVVCVYVIVYICRYLLSSSTSFSPQELKYGEMLRVAERGNISIPDIVLWKTNITQRGWFCFVYVIARKSQSSVKWVLYPAWSTSRLSCMHLISSIHPISVFIRMALTMRWLLKVWAASKRVGKSFHSPIVESFTGDLLLFLTCPH